MDARNVRVIRNYEDMQTDENAVYIDDTARFYLGNLAWDTKIIIKGRRDVEGIIKPLKAHDGDGQIARMSEQLRDKAMIEWGEEVLLEHM